MLKRSPDDEAEPKTIDSKDDVMLREKERM